jgi:biotin synthase
LRESGARDSDWVLVHDAARCLITPALVDALIDACMNDPVGGLLALPLPDLLFRAQTVHREHFDPTRVQFSTLLSIKTGGCPEDCAYCPQSARFRTGVEDEPLMAIDDVVAAATAARAAGASRFCMGAAWRGPKQRDLAQVADMVRAVKGLGLETCATLGLLKDGQVAFALV